MNARDCADLIDDLMRYAANATSAQRAQAERIITFMRTHDAPWRRSNRVGHLTASAWITDASHDRALLLHHRKLDRWLQPGGHIDDDDASVLHAALREATEETGLTSLTLAPAPTSDRAYAVFDVDVHPIPARGGEPAHEHYDIRFHLIAGTTEVALNTNESNALAWRDLNDVANDATIDPSVRRMATLTLTARRLIARRERD